MYGKYAVSAAKNKIKKVKESEPTIKKSIGK